MLYRWNILMIDFIGIPLSAYLCHQQKILAVERFVDLVFGNDMEFYARQDIRITITVESTRETTILEAMVNSPFKAISGKVIYYNTKDNSIFRVVEFKYAYIVYYKEVYNVDRKRQMYSTITFSADIIMIGDAYLSNQW